ncbi:MAG: hypothetical protein CO113_15600 [Elusimicrobia bacterium CG_4_9_14_3_um_filter_62_55]|nr:MAG: hypothetical protein COR54_00745 [Elusimicrobia bacterium CG22_combo_CG10-13_8_21_14_all_63_91]PJA18369.1 MAG: hypothetical protein COX66_01380 [Elusimicrobia bacterium CG_4_10_14_0_2_um_filter_63_34]PJB24114.1 MAG: hypothetical protein CO113_15600 [Elusimicrobia bacterium CG_4_9_14_3_um_filter_62_55]
MIGAAAILSSLMAANGWAAAPASPDASWTGGAHLAVNIFRRQTPFERFGLKDPNQIMIAPLEGEGKNEREARLKARLRSSLERMPDFLKTGVTLKSVFVIEIEKGAMGHGHEDSGNLTLRVAADDPNFDAVTAHELSHAYDEQNEAVVNKFLKLRYWRKDFDLELRRLWAHVRETSEKDESGRIVRTVYDEAAQKRLAELKVPRRWATDFHAANKPTEYWAVAVELYYRHKTAGTLSEMKSHLSEPEIRTLAALFGP